MGEYKGYGLSLITDVLTGVMGGSAFGSALYADPAKQDVGHQFTAYDIEWFMPRARILCPSGRVHRAWSKAAALART